MRSWLKQVDVAQRRHASSRTAVELSQPPSTSSSSDNPDWSTTFNTVARGYASCSAEDAWHAYQCYSDKHKDDLRVSRQVLNFFTNLITSFVSGRHGGGSPGYLYFWGNRIHEALRELEATVPDAPEDEFRMQLDILFIATTAMRGELSEAMDAVQRMSSFLDSLSVSQAKPLRGHVLQAYAVIIHALRCHRRSTDVLDLLVQESDVLYDSFKKPPPLKPTVELFTSTAMDALASLEDAARYIQSQSHLWSKPQLSIAASLCIRAAVRAHHLHDALAIARISRSLSVPLPLPIDLLVVRALIKARLYDEAGAYFDTVPPPEDKQFGPYHATGLFLRSQQGDAEESEKHFQELAQRNLASDSDRGLVLHAHATAGNVARVTELFHEFFPTPTDTTPSPPQPNVIHYTNVIHAHAQAGDLDGINEWLEKLTQSGLRPDLHVYSIILESFAKRGDVTSMSALLDQMRETGVKLNHVIYTTIISTFAQRGDPMAAERLYKRAVSEGVVPDRTMVTALMHAHVETGSWQGVIRAWDYLNTPGHPGSRVTIEVFNTLMKAYILIGAPFSTVANVFRLLPRRHLRPDARTFALLIQSACDSGFMDIAQDLCTEMERLAERNQKSMDVNVYALTILMSGYLRQGRRVKAKAVLDHMKLRGIELNAVSYAAILKAYGAQRSDEGLKVAEAFLNSLTSKGDDSWLRLAGGRQLTVLSVYQPLLAAYNKRFRPEDVYRLYGDLLQAGGTPTLGTLTVLLDAHRRSGDVEGMLTMWPKIVEYGLEFARQNSLLGAESDRPPDFSGYGCLMCVPFSIYMDALSTAGKHAEVAQAWKALKDHGLQFDSHNWNHLSVALVRAGEPLRAFDVVENVILRYQRQSRRQLTRERDMHPSSPLTLDLPPPEEGDLPPHRPEAPLHAAERRTFVAKRNTRRMGKRRSAAKEDQEQEDKEPDHDFAHPLHIMHSMSPLWNIWRPHGATLVLLSAVLDHLNSGRLIQPLTPGRDEEFEQMAVDAEEMRKRTEAAGLVLGEIYERYPQTVQLIREYDLMRRAARRIGHRS